MKLQTILLHLLHRMGLQMENWTMMNLPKHLDYPKHLYSVKSLGFRLVNLTGYYLHLR
jgi:hypothetical protein